MLLANLTSLAISRIYRCATQPYKSYRHFLVRDVLPMVFLPADSFSVHEVREFSRNREHSCTAQIVYHSTYVMPQLLLPFKSSRGLNVPISQDHADDW